MKRVARNNEVDLLMLRISTEEYVFEEWSLDDTPALVSVLGL